MRTEKPKKYLLMIFSPSAALKLKKRMPSLVFAKLFHILHYIDILTYNATVRHDSTPPHTTRDA